jgi:hypothetical protein
MKNLKVLTVLLAAGMALSPVIANAKKGGGESQKGGLPGLEDRVEADEGLITTLQGQVLDLQGQNNWAVVASDCSITSSSSSAGTPTSTDLGTGQCEITFGKDVGACAVNATIEGSAGGEVSVAGATKTNPGDSVIVYTFLSTGNAADSSFNLSVTCP